MARSPSQLEVPPRGLAMLLLGLWGLGLLAAGPLYLPEGFHHFADQRALFGIANAADVLSNLPFLIVGGIGLARVFRRPGPGAESFGLCFAALALTAFGSGWYHLVPGDERLIFDRIPIVWASLLILLLFLRERVDPAIGSRHATLTMLALATATPFIAHATGDLRAYLYLQLAPLVLIPVLLWRAPAGGSRPAHWLAMLGLYVLAKAAEVADHVVLDATGFLSGHTLKHVFAGAAAALLLPIHAAWRPVRS